MYELGACVMDGADGDGMGRGGEVRRQEKGINIKVPGAT